MNNGQQAATGIITLVGECLHATITEVASDSLALMRLGFGRAR